MKIIQNVIEHIKAFLLNYVNNSSHTLYADIKELFATYVLSIGYYLIYILPQRDNLKRTKELKNIKKGRRCFVFANGPSMNLLDVKKIEKYQNAGFDVICVNSYILSDMADTVVPDYYVLSDPISFGASKNLVPDAVMNAQKKVIERVNDLNIPVFIPAQFTNNSLKHYYIFNDFGNKFTSNINPIKQRGYSSMTAYKALAIACYLGYDTIFICGFDNDYFKSFSVDDNNDIYYIDRHYFDAGLKRIVRPNKGEGLGNLLWEHHLLFKNLELFKKCNIINLNKNGLVDAFSKKHDLDVLKVL